MYIMWVEQSYQTRKLHIHTAEALLNRFTITMYVIHLSINNNKYLPSNEFYSCEHQTHPFTHYNGG